MSNPTGDALNAGKADKTPANFEQWYKTAILPAATTKASSDALYTKMSHEWTWQAALTHRDQQAGVEQDSHAFKTAMFAIHEELDKADHISEKTKEGLSNIAAIAIKSYANFLRPHLAPKLEEKALVNESGGDWELVYRALFEALTALVARHSDELADCDRAMMVQVIYVVQESLLIAAKKVGEARAQCFVAPCTIQVKGLLKRIECWLEDHNNIMSKEDLQWLLNNKYREELGDTNG